MCEGVLMFVERGGCEDVETQEWEYIGNSD